MQDQDGKLIPGLAYTLSACSHAAKSTERLIRDILNLTYRHSKILGDLLKRCWGFTVWWKERRDNLGLKLTERLNRYLDTGGGLSWLLHGAYEWQFEIA